ncbi:hypothetical protein Vadar_004961 [Vaccinium darrowii]|uniref:Uncharacterized protein n=1 Tax=Vaccinium darrowii TaxID=229202 RepID=A0ACB7YJC9_9ERIC|nr:hypothetical protein Vadar_004961 [Vaccinium darrowii]
MEFVFVWKLCPGWNPTVSHNLKTNRGRPGKSSTTPTSFRPSFRISESSKTIPQALTDYIYMLQRRWQSFEYCIDAMEVHTHRVFSMASYCPTVLAAGDKERVYLKCPTNIVGTAFYCLTRIFNRISSAKTFTSFLGIGDNRKRGFVLNSYYLRLETNKLETTLGRRSRFLSPLLPHCLSYARYCRKKVKKQDLPEDDSELYLDPTLALYKRRFQTGLPVILVDGYNVCGYWAKLKKHHV